jgi:hypothetical protein
MKMIGKEGPGQTIDLGIPNQFAQPLFEKPIVPVVEEDFPSFKELVWKIWTSQKAVLSDKLLGSCRYLTPMAGSPVNLIWGPIVKSLVPPPSVIELEIYS